MAKYITLPKPWGARVAALVATLCMVAFPLAASAQVFLGLSFNIGTPPPAMPYYAYSSQPALAFSGEVWQPGYWAWGPYGYYWVPGTWVMPPSAGLYWTPGYWSNDNGYYAWNNGYWAPQVGFYGGVDYGFGYYGNGYVGGFWNNGVFAYNTAVTNVVPSVVQNLYVNRTVIVRRIVRTSFNGRGGVIVRPTARELVVMRERHVGPTSVQVQHARIAARDRDLLASVNHDRPAVLAVGRPMTSTRVLRDFHPVTVADRRVAQRTVSASHTAQSTHVAHVAHAQVQHRAPAQTAMRQRELPIHASTSQHSTRVPTHSTQRTSTTAKSPAQKQQRPTAQQHKPPTR